MFILAYQMNKNLDKFPAKMQPAINFIMNAAYGILIAAGAFVFCYYVYGDQVPTPFAEWVVALYYANFFGIISFTNNFYETVHEKKLLAAFYVKDQ